MEHVLHEPIPGNEIRAMLSHGLDMPHCSPCEIKLTDAPLPPLADDPYDTARCDPFCVGKWEPALRRFAIYLLHKLNDRAGDIANALERRGLRAPHRDDSIVTIRLKAGGDEFLFKLSTESHGHLHWQGSPAHGLATKDGVLKASILLGSSGSSPLPAAFKGRDGHMTVLHIQLPRIELRRFRKSLEPKAMAVGGQLLIEFTLNQCNARLYSKHRLDRGDAEPSQSRRAYMNPATGLSWEYLSGPRGRRLARLPGRKAVNVDEQSDSSEHTWAEDSEDNRTPSPR